MNIKKTDKALRKLAQGKPCMIRLPGCCFNTDTTVLAHIRTESTGMGQKEFSFFGAWACQSCHDYVDRRKQLPEGWEIREVTLSFFEGVFRTQKEIILEHPEVLSCLK